MSIFTIKLSTLFRKIYEIWFDWIHTASSITDSFISRQYSFGLLHRVVYECPEVLEDKTKYLYCTRQAPKNVPLSEETNTEQVNHFKYLGS